MIRLLDLNQVSYLHSQSIYHAVAYCTSRTSPGTIIILRPREPYVCIGYHQLLEETLDREYCNSKGIPIVRREVGGGAVYLDKDQLFFQCVFPKEKVPLKIENLYKFFLQPAINTYRRFGIDARFQPINDILVDDKKICGTGAGRIEDASVVVGNILLDFNYEEMSRVLRLSSEAFRKKVHESMCMYLTSLHGQLGHKPGAERVKDILIEEFERLPGQKLQRGRLTDEERSILAKIDDRFIDPDWLNQDGGKKDNAIKITTDVKVMESAYHSRGGLIKTILRLKGDVIDDITVSGNFHFQPQIDFKQLEDRLRGRPFEADLLLRIVESFYTDRGIEPEVAGPEEMVRAIVGEKTMGDEHAGN